MLNKSNNHKKFCFSNLIMIYINFFCKYYANSTPVKNSLAPAKKAVTISQTPINK